MIRVALIGYGYAGRIFHAPLIRATPGLELVVVASSRPDRVHADRPAVPVVASPEAACGLPLVDLVVIATPNDTHKSIAAMALHAGKHVVVDKPFAPTLDDARELASLARNRNLVLSVFQNRRWDGDFLTIADLLARNALGDVVHFESHFDRYRPQVRDRWRERAGAGAGLWYDLGPHIVDQALQLFGLPGRVAASMAAQRKGAQTDDWAHVILEYRRLRVVLHTAVLSAAPLPRFIVHGEAASWIKYGLDAQERQLAASWTPPTGASARDVEHSVLVDGASGAETPIAVPRGDYGRFYALLRDTLQGTGVNPVPPEHAIPVMAVVETAIRAAAEGRALELPLTDEEVRAFHRASRAGGPS